MITHIAHMDQDQSTDRSGEYLVYGNAADATTFASGMSALGFRSSVQGQRNLGLVASRNPDIIKAYGGMMGGISRPGHDGGVRPDSALRYSPFARSLVAASCRPRNSSCGVRRSHRHRSNGFDQCADPRLLQRFSSMDAMVSLVNPGMDTSIAVLLIVEIVTLAIAWSNAEILAQVKGRMTSLPVFSASYLLRFPVAMLVILLIISVTLAARELWCYEDQQDQWTTVDRHGGGSHSVASARLSSTPPARSVWLTQSAHGWVT